MEFYLAHDIDTTYITPEIRRFLTPAEIHRFDAVAIEDVAPELISMISEREGEYDHTEGPPEDHFADLRGDIEEFQDYLMAADDECANKAAELYTEALDILDQTVREIERENERRERRENLDSYDYGPELRFYDTAETRKGESPSSAPVDHSRIDLPEVERSVFDDVDA
jgi:hypothetical protein